MQKAPKTNAKTSTQPSPRMIKLGQYLKYLREDLDMSLRKAAKLARISPAYLCKIEKRAAFKSIGIEVLIGLSNVYGIPLSSILKECNLIQEKNDELPELPQYLHSKYRLPPQAIRDMETAKEVVEKKYKRKESSQLDLL